MAMQTATVRFAPEEKAWIQSYADFVGMSFSDVVREAVLEVIEELADARDFAQALEEDDGQRFDLADVKKDLGL